MSNRSIVTIVLLCLFFLAAAGASAQSNSDGGVTKPVPPPPNAGPSDHPAAVGDNASQSLNTPKVKTGNGSGNWVSREWVANQNKLLRSLIVTLAGEKVAAAEESHEANLSETQILERRLGLVKQLVEASRPKP